MTLTVLDYFIIGSFFVISILIGAVASRHAGKSFSEYFLAGGKMSWWMLGISMVATTFAADTPNLVTNIVRKNGVSGNWVWWAFLLTGLLTVFVYARLWKRSGVSDRPGVLRDSLQRESSLVLKGFSRDLPGRRI